MKNRVSARAYAAEIGRHEETVTKWCRNAALPKEKRKKGLPPMVAKRVGRDWQIDVAATERAQSIECGTALEKELARKSLL